MSEPDKASATGMATGSALSTEIDCAMADIVNAFLRWPLPDSVASDTCCNRPGKGRTGTNLLTCPETVAMVQEAVRPSVELLIRRLRNGKR